MDDFMPHMLTCLNLHSESFMMLLGAQSSISVPFLLPFFTM